MEIKAATNRVFSFYLITASAIMLSYMSKKAIQIDEKDNVATTTEDIILGDKIEVINSEGKVILQQVGSEAIPFGHKISIKPIKKGGDIIKYGEVIGVSRELIKAGMWVNTHNLGSARMPTSGKEEGIL